jgi:hypothetical protein
VGKQEKDSARELDAHNREKRLSWGLNARSREQGAANRGAGARAMGEGRESFGQGDARHGELGQQGSRDMGGARGRGRAGEWARHGWKLWGKTQRARELGVDMEEQGAQSVGEEGEREKGASREGTRLGAQQENEQEGASAMGSQGLGCMWLAGARVGDELEGERAARKYPAAAEG